MDWAELHHLISTYFDSEELRTLCFDIGVDYDTLRGEGKDAKSRELIQQCRRDNRVAALIARLRILRPDVVWDDLPAIAPSPSRWMPFEAVDEHLQQQYEERHNRIKKELRVIDTAIAILGVGAIILSMALLNLTAPNRLHLWLLVVGWCFLGLAAVQGLVRLINMTARSIKYQLQLRRVLEAEPDDKYFELIRLPPTSGEAGEYYADIFAFVVGVILLMSFFAVNLLSYR